MTRARSSAIGLLLAVTVLLVAAAPALAADGVGLWGRTNDRVVTFFSLAVLAFFAILVVFLSLIQHRLESRKERARADLERLSRP